jgi:hypothetical protein
MQVHYICALIDKSGTKKNCLENPYFINITVSLKINNPKVKNKFSE